ncbi:MAG TPA: hypothetical protein VLB73_02440 [Patescibacteria group bacterium]|nr:hypothetical protein [Patescibacteria group bacterium]
MGKSEGDQYSSYPRPSGPLLGLRGPILDEGKGGFFSPIPHSSRYAHPFPDYETGDLRPGAGSTQPLSPRRDPQFV